MNQQKLRGLGPWLAEQKELFLGLAMITLALATIHLFGCTEQTIRLSGMVLQISGTSTVIWGVHKTRKQFGHPPLYLGLAAWLRRCPLRTRAASILADSAIGVGVAVLGGRLYSPIATAPAKPVDERLTAIERSLHALQDRVAATESQLDRERSDTHGRLAAEARERERGDHEILKTVESSSTGGLHIALMGACWLIAGIALATAAPEIARMNSYWSPGHG